MSEEIKAAEGKEESFEELLNQSFKTLNTGEKVTGIVTAITPTEVQVDVGAKQAAYIKLSELSDDPTAKPEDIVKVGDEIETYIVRVNDVEGYAELSWSRIKTPSEVCKVGDTLDVYVISFDPEKHKISLGVKDRTLNPWDVFMNKYSVGDVASVRIVKLMTFGAFAEVVPGVDGLIHISQIADRRIEKPGDVLSEGQMVDAKITAIDEEKQKISLSIRALLGSHEDEADEAEVEE